MMEQLKYIKQQSCKIILARKVKSNLLRLSKFRFYKK
jgi:hypothetical protein